MSDESIEDILRDAGIQWKAGMLTMTDARVVAVTDLRIALAVEPPCRVASVPKETHTPDLRDSATYALCLAQLARRLKVGPEQGCVMQTSDYSDPPAWFVVGHGVALVPVPKETDHRRALALALRATAPKETSNG
jgi:hypothetical protein